MMHAKTRKDNMLNLVLEPLKPRNVRLFFAADLSYYLSFWLIYINLAWVVYALTNSSFDLGVLGAIFYLPMFLITPFSGIIADRFDRRLILICCQAAIFIPVLLLSSLNYWHALSYGLVLILTFLYSSCSAVLYPAYSAYIQDIVENKADTPRVIGILSTNTRTSQFISGGLNALIHLVASFTAAFFSALFFNFIALICLFKIRKPFVKPPAVSHKPWQDLSAGFRYIFNFKPFWSVVLVVAAVNIFVGTYQFQLPVFAADYLGGNIHILSYIYGVGGIGGILAGIYMGIRKHSKHLMKLTAIALAISGAGLFLFANSSNVIFSLIMSFVIDATYIIVLAGGSATLLTLVADEMRGRAMGIFGMTFVGLLPLGQLIIGALAEVFNARTAISIVGLICIVIAIWYLFNIKILRTMVQFIYQEKNILDVEQPI